MKLAECSSTRARSAASRSRRRAFDAGPLVLAGAVTLEVCALAGIVLNFANVVALPLLLGVGGLRLRPTLTQHEQLVVRLFGTSYSTVADTAHEWSNFGNDIESISRRVVKPR
jgi:hypothetical protein